MRRISILLALLALVAGVLALPGRLISRTDGSADFLHFESGQVRPMTMTPDGTRLLVVNTPDARLSVFDLTQGAPSALTRLAEIPVGLEPVSVSARSDSEAWVVNWLSDDISIVNLNTMHVRATLHVGDEPGDVVFAGSPERAYVSVGNEDVVKVYDPANLATVPTVIPIAARGPRALARNAAGTLVFVASLYAGNRTTVLAPLDVPADSMPQDPELPRQEPTTPPRVGLIVQQQGGNWYDSYGNLWNSKVKYSQLDNDVTEISTASNTVNRAFSNIGSVVFGLAVDPVSGRLGAVATESRNMQRFEPRLIGYTVETNVGFVGVSGTLSLRRLNPDNLFDFLVTPGPQSEHDSAIAIPTGIAFNAAGTRAYATALGSNKLAVMNPTGGAFTTVLARIPTLPGPTGVVVDDARGTIYVLGRYHNEVQTLSASTFQQQGRTAIGFDPTPDEIVNGRKFLYAGFTSGHGTEACASCHIFGDTDHMAWDLGDPLGAHQNPPPGQFFGGQLEGFDPMKGPTTTQSLRGMPGTGVLHWRGDRADFSAFNGAFVSLMGRLTALADSELTAFTEFALPLRYPPNPNQHLDRSFPEAPPGQPSAARGKTFFLTHPSDGGIPGFTCNSCHIADSAGSAGRPGTNGQIIPDELLGTDQDIKVPHLRNLYKKTGFKDTVGAVNKRGTGYTHDGTTDNLMTFLRLPVFDFGPPAEEEANRRDVEAYMMSFDTGLSPAVGYQMTFTGANNSDPEMLLRADTLRGAAALGHCDLIAKGRVAGQSRGWKYVGGDQWQPDKTGESAISSATLIALAGPGSEVTVMGVPMGSGTRMGVDRDRDGYPNGTELDAGSDPGNPASTPLNVGVGPTKPVGFAMRQIGPNPFRVHADVSFTLGRAGHVDLAVYDVLGREVRSVARRAWLEAGPNALRWDGRTNDGHAVAAGVYFVRLRTEGGTWTRPVVRMN